VERRLPFTAIPRVIESALDAAVGHAPADPSTLAEVRELDAWARRFSSSVAGG
jgi:1-deoxy-D-xylulose 5-phosphate reductoisomerase